MSGTPAASLRFSVENVVSPGAGAAVGEIAEIAEFLAAFSRDGELPDASEAERKPELWARRLGVWWERNPFARESEPLGLILRGPEGEIAGFHGLIPQDYVRGAEVLPGLIATTFFVRESARHAALGLVMRVKRLGQTHHLVDGTPSEEVLAIWERLGLQRAPAGTQHYRFRLGLRPFSLRRLMLAPAALLTGSKPASSPSHVIVDPAKIVSVPTPPDAKLRKRVTPDGLAWMLASAARPLYFCGAVDSNGSLRAYFLAEEKRKLGLRFARILECASFDENGSALQQLVDFAATEPAACGLPADTDAVVWTLLNPEHRPQWRLRSSWSTNQYFLPPPSGSEGAETGKVSQPSESDSLFV